MNGDAEQPPKTAADTPTTAEPPVVNWSQRCSENSDFAELVGLDRSMLIARLGNPAQEEQFLLGERPHEFHVRLQNTYPLSEPGNAQIPIQELTYVSEQDRLTIWLHQQQEKWVVFEHLCWSSDMEF